MNWRQNLGLSLSFLITFAGFRSQAAEPATAAEMRRSRFTQILKMDLEDTHAQSAGKVTDFLLGRSRGLVRFGIVANGGTLGLGRSHKIVPASALNLNTAKTSVLGLSVSRFKLAESFEFHRRDLPNLQKHGHARELDLLFGLTKANQPANGQSGGDGGLEPTGGTKSHSRNQPPDTQLVPASEVIGGTILSAHLQKIGKIRDLLIDPSGRHESIAIISSGHFLKRSSFFAVPFRRLATTTNNQYTVDADIVAFASAPPFDFREWANGTAPDTICAYNDIEPDNTAKNRTPTAASRPTPDRQSESPSDVRLTKQIRQEINRAAGLSFTARNIKIITVSGKVTLRGPVLTSGERDRILGVARQIAGTESVRDEMEVKN